MITAEQIIKHYNMKPLPDEGGYYTETYRSTETICKNCLGPTYNGIRNVNTTILYLLTPDQCSKMHKVKSDEIFHFYFGDKVQMLQLYADRKSRVITMGTNILDSEELQVTVPKEIWQGATLKQGGKFALLGCSVSPGFEFDDYQHGSRDQLIAQYPDAAEMITRLT